MRVLKFITGHVIYNPDYTYKFQLKTTQDWNTFECYSLKLEEQCRKDAGNNQTTWNRNNCTTYEQYCQNHDYSHYIINIVSNNEVLD